MGRKGVSKRKPKQAKNVKGSSNTQQGAGSAVQVLVKGKAAPLNSNNMNFSIGAIKNKEASPNSGNMNFSIGSIKKNKKGK